MKKKIFSAIIIAVIALVLVFSAVACKSDEDTTVNVSINVTDDGISAYLTAVVRSYFSGTSNYVYFSEDAGKTITKMQSEKLTRGVCVAYLTADDFALVLDSEKDLTVIAIDNYGKDGNINGYWVARKDWLESAPKSSKKFTNAIMQGIDYRSNHMSVSFEDAMATIKAQPTEYELSDFDDVNYYIAAYVVGNDDLEVVRSEFVSPSVATINSDYQGFDNASGELYADCLNMYNKAVVGASNPATFEEAFSLTTFGTLMSEYLAK